MKTLNLALIPNVGCLFFRQFAHEIPLEEDLLIVASLLSLSAPLLARLSPNFSGIPISALGRKRGAHGEFSRKFFLVPDFLLFHDLLHPEKLLTFHLVHLTLHPLHGIKQTGDNLNNRKRQMS